MSKDKFARLLRDGAFTPGAVERAARKSAVAVASLTRLERKKLVQRGVRKAHETRRTGALTVA